MSGMDLDLEMVDHHVWLVDQLVQRATTLSDDQLDEPFTGQLDGVDGDTLRWSLSRLIGQMAMWCAAMQDGEYDFAVEDHESVSSMRQRLAVTGPAFVAAVREVASEERFDETFVEPFSPEPVVMTYGAMVAHVLTFAAHHRLLAVTRMRDLGITDLGLGDPKAWFARQVSNVDQAS
jgi:uncharacterized damage-inducible protein DinB